MKKILLILMSVFLLFLGASQAYAYSLVVDVDTGINYYDPEDTNPDLINSSTAEEKLWLEALLGFSVDFYGNQDNSTDAFPEDQIDSTITFRDNWTYAVLKYGRGQDDWDHVAIKSDLNDLGQEIDPFPIYETIFDPNSSGNRISHITYFNSVPEPSAMLLLGSGLILIAGLRRKFK